MSTVFGLIAPDISLPEPSYQFHGCLQCRHSHQLSIMHNQLRVHHLNTLLFRDMESSPKNKDRLGILRLDISRQMPKLAKSVLMRVKETTLKWSYFRW